MLSKTRLSIIALGALAGGCHLPEQDGKSSCNVAEDCLSGYQCVNGTCTGGGSIHLPDAPGGTFFGTVEPMTSQSAGMAAANYSALVAVTTAPGTLGCAVVGDLEASPGADAAVVYAKVPGGSSDSRCPMGTFAIKNDPNACNPSFPGELYDNCAIYKRWDGTGKQVANQLATGGYVSVTRTYLNDMAYRCTADVSIRFAGGVTIAKMFTFDYNPLAPTSVFCKH
jgi:hypothetical protein